MMKAITEGNRLSKLLTEALTQLGQAANDAAQEEHNYKKAHADAYLKAEGTVAERNAIADRDTAKELLEYRKAQAVDKVQMEVVRSLRQQLSFAQTATNALRAEMETLGHQEG